MHRSKNDVKIGMKRNWKGLEGVGSILETPENYWKAMVEQYLF
jgi:hypothetical protein